MSIKSYLVFPKAGKKKKTIDFFAEQIGCEVYPSTNKDLIILVVDLIEDIESKMMDKIWKQDLVNQISLVSGYQLNEAL